MALGKTAKRQRNLMNVIQPKLDDKILTDKFYEKFKEILKTKTSTYLDKDREIEVTNKFKMYVYNHKLLGGLEMTKKEWLTWIENERENNK